jgi:hypothetical protein
MAGRHESTGVKNVVQVSYCVDAQQILLGQVNPESVFDGYDEDGAGNPVDAGIGDQMCGPTDSRGVDTQVSAEDFGQLGADFLS